VATLQLMVVALQAQLAAKTQAAAAPTPARAGPPVLDAGALAAKAEGYKRSIATQLKAQMVRAWVGVDGVDSGVQGRGRW
jgi:hypothetical protein